LPAGDYSIQSVSETLTVPTFTLQTTLNDGTNLSGPVTGVNLLHLSIAFKRAGYSTISFVRHATDSRTTSGTHTTATLHVFDMQWNDGTTVDLATRQPYCTLAPVGGVADLDWVVFQQGIIVNALNGRLNQNSSYVTLSCRKGGIATARKWGYVYRGTAAQANMFETAIHMKRASYCGDATFYTRRNTDIFIRDSATINDDDDPTTGSSALTFPDADFEASWGYDSASGTFRALCVNVGNRRRPGAEWPPPVYGGGNTFNGHCADGTTIPLGTAPGGPGCPLPPTQPMWIADQYNP